MKLDKLMRYIQYMLFSANVIITGQKPDYRCKIFVL